MKYQQPFGQTDPNAAYVNGNPATGVQGSIPPAAAIEEPQREIVNLITAAGYTPSDSDLYQLTRGVRSGTLVFAIDTGSANHLSVAFNPPHTAYRQGLFIRVLVANNNTGACDINVSGLGAVAIKMLDGSNPTANTLRAGSIASLVYDGTNFELVSGPITINNNSTVNYNNLNIPYVADSSPTPNVITAPYSPAITTISEGNFISVKLANTVTGHTTIAVNALAPLPVFRYDGTDLQTNDCIQGEVLLLVNRTTWYQVVNQVGLTSQPAVATAPFYPEVTTGGGLMTVTASGGNVVISNAPVQSWQWRALRNFQTSAFSTANLTFATAANKTYHLRWDAPGTGQATPASSWPSGRFSLRDLADATYNPTSLGESNIAFDSTYDSMLVARVTTNATNVATITPLLNQAFLKTSVGRNTGADIGGWANSLSDVYTINWSRSPQLQLNGINPDAGITSMFGGNQAGFLSWTLAATSVSRYGFTVVNAVSASNGENYAVFYTYQLVA